MTQTKESFDRYLEQCRAENKHGDRPPVESISCPLCPGLDATLRSVPWENVVEEVVYAGTHWYYLCDNCAESWTTSESDGVSLASLISKA